MSEQRRGLGDHPLVVLVALVAGIIAIVVFATGRDSLPSFFEKESAEEVVTPTAPADLAATAVFSTTPADSANGVDCSQLIESVHVEPQVGQFWVLEPINEDRNIHIWSNHWEDNMDVGKLFLPAGESGSFESGGGVYWADQPGCSGPTRVAYDRDTLPPITAAEYQRYIAEGVVP